MKRLVMAGLSMSIILSGCATEDFVRQQISPINERLGTLEQQVKDIDAKISQPAKFDLSPADRAVLDDSRNMAQKALDESARTAAVMKQANADASRAEAAAAKAEDAAKRAEDAAGRARQSEKKSEKIFKLEQKK